MKVSGVVIRLGTQYSGANINIDTMEEFVFFILCLRDLALLTVCK